MIEYEGVALRVANENDEKDEVVAVLIDNGTPIMITEEGLSYALSTGRYNQEDARELAKILPSVKSADPTNLVKAVSAEDFIDKRNKGTSFELNGREEFGCNVDDFEIPTVGS